MKDEKKIVLLDCVGQDIQAKPFSFEHASNIFTIQAKTKRNDWTLSPGQNYQLHDGKLDERANIDNPSGRKKARRTDDVPQA